MEIKSIKTDVDYQETLQGIKRLMNATAHTTEGDQLDVLITLVEAYERKHFPMGLPPVFCS